METTIRYYRYALRPTPEQARSLDRAAAQARRLWNELTSLLCWAENEQRWGRREALLHRYEHLLAAKAAPDPVIVQNPELPTERGPSSAADATASDPCAEAATAARQWDTRRLALAYAVERAQLNARRKPLIFSMETVVAIVERFADAASHYVTGQGGKPRSKGDDDSISWHQRVSASSASPVDWRRGTVDLAALLCYKNARAVRAILHRPLPDGAKIKQLCVTQTATGAFVALMIEAPASAFVRVVPESTAVAGMAEILECLATSLPSTRCSASPLNCPTNRGVIATSGRRHS